MAKQFKVKYKERAALARALQREIKQQGLVDTWTLHDGVRIAATSNVNMNGVNITVVAPYYYYFLDEGTRTIRPHDITADWLQRPKVQALVNEITQQYIAWRISNFDIFTDPDALNGIPDRVKVGFDLFGDPTGKWNLKIPPESF